MVSVASWKKKLILILGGILKGWSDNFNYNQNHFSHRLHWVLKRWLKWVGPVHRHLESLKYTCCPRLSCWLPENDFHCSPFLPHSSSCCIAVALETWQGVATNPSYFKGWAGECVQVNVCRSNAWLALSSVHLGLSSDLFCANDRTTCIWCCL